MFWSMIAKRTIGGRTMEKKTETRVGLGFAEALTILFIALKLTGVIAWSWLWVLAPLWLPACLALLIACVVVLCRH